MLRFAPTCQLRRWRAERQHHARPFSARRQFLLEERRFLILTRTALTSRRRTTAPLFITMRTRIACYFDVPRDDNQADYANYVDVRPTHTCFPRPNSN